MKIINFILVSFFVFLVACSAETTNTTEPSKPIIVNNTVKTPTRVECTLDTMDCPDGTVVYRSPENNCEFDPCISIPEKNFEANYVDGKLTYMAVIEKPTPCHKLTVRQLQLETYPVQIIIDVRMEGPTKGIMCAQVMSPEVINGYVLSDHKPANIRVNLDGRNLYKSTLN